LTRLSSSNGELQARLTFVATRILHTPCAVNYQRDSAGSPDPLWRPESRIPNPENPVASQATRLNRQPRQSAYDFIFSNLNDLGKESEQRTGHRHSLMRRPQHQSGRQRSAILAACEFRHEMAHQVESKCLRRVQSSQRCSTAWTCIRLDCMCKATLYAAHQSKHLLSATAFWRDRARVSEDLSWEASLRSTMTGCKRVIRYKLQAGHSI
jgi:hypothetical protein